MTDTAIISIDFNGSPSFVVKGRRWHPVTSTLNAQILLWIGSMGKCVRTYETSTSKHRMQTWKIPTSLLKMINLACHSTRFPRKIETALYSGNFSDLKGADAELEIIARAIEAHSEPETKPFIVTQPNGAVLVLRRKIDNEWAITVTYKTAKHFVAFKTDYASERTFITILRNPLVWVGRALRKKIFEYGVIRFDGKYYTTCPQRMRSTFTPNSVFDGAKVVKISSKSFNALPLWTPEFGKTVYTAIKYDVDIGVVESLQR